MEKKRASYIERIAKPVPIRDFLHATRTLGDVYAREGGERSFERTIGILMRLFPKREEGKVAAIMLRMEALGNLKDHPLMRVWRAETGERDFVYIDESILKGAARHPLSLTNDNLEFDADSFFARVLSYAKREGRA